jgi:hypothetical protein
MAKELGKRFPANFLLNVHARGARGLVDSLFESVDQHDGRRDDDG